MTALEVLKKYWGYDSFRAPQDEIIAAVLEGKDTLALLPTGGGKSVCYQVPALMKEGVCIVVSPLIALMKDQVLHLRKRKIRASAVFSGMSRHEIDIILDNCIYGNVKLLYVSPERLKTELFRERLTKMNVSLFAVDEAHCISQWGYDFRPPYLEIAEIRSYHPDVPVLALTASATKKVSDDICHKLDFKKGYKSFRKSFSRPNISFLSYDDGDKEGKLLKICKKVSGSGIVYVRNRKKTKEIAELLQKEGIKADYYHAGLDMRKRNARQEAWINGHIRVIVSTNAFGMGIDKADVRFVIHIGLPDSLESYYQEAGRAGRDGKRAYAAILFNRRDASRLKQSVEEKYPPIDFVKKVYQNLCDYYSLALGSGSGYSFDFEIVDFCRTFRLQPLHTFNALRILENEGLIVLNDAVYLSPRVKVVCERQVLYELEVSNRQLAPVTQAILRSYEGAFDYYVRINEKQLAATVGLSVEQLRKKLEQLQKLRIISYEPYKDKPQIMFLLPRQSNKSDLGMNVSAIAFRRKVSMEKARGMLFYVHNKVKCRERVILEYFDERSLSNCGHCDVCRERERESLRSDAFDLIFEEIRNVLLKEPKSVRDLPELIKAGNQDVVKAVRWLTDQGLIRENEEMKLEWAE